MAEKESWRSTLDPARNPAVLDTLTWDESAAARVASSQPREFWQAAYAALRGGRPSPTSPAVTLHDCSAAHLGGTDWVLVEHSDGQHVLAGFAPSGRQPLLPAPLLRLSHPDGAAASFHEVTPGNLHLLYTQAAPTRLPRALPTVPRLGIGTRMSRAVWPGIWQALEECSFSANAIQNSQRELNLLEELEQRRPARTLYYPGVGFVPEGHTGSTFEGLWLCGVAEALKAGVTRPYGADADHIMVKRGPDGLERALQVLAAARRYSFFTLDVSDILDYSAVPEGSLERCIGNERTRMEVLSWYRSPLAVGGASISIGESELAAMVGKYWTALETLSLLVPHIDRLRGGEAFDLEISVDEHPPEVHPFDCITSEAEAAFILAEARRRGLRLTHLAPNLGVEKHVDYRCPDGLPGLEARMLALHRLASGEGVLIDCHSGDDLSAATRQALRRATGGQLHFKVSPSLQDLFADVLYDFDRHLFGLWWDDTVAFSRENAREGSAVAAGCLKEYEDQPGPGPRPEHRLFRLYGYATVGKRSARGDFLYRERFYSLGQEFSDEYTRRVKTRLCALAGDLLG